MATDVSLLNLCRYNAWANAKLVDLLRAAPAEALTDAAPGTTGAIADTFKHLVGVEDLYLASVQGRDVAEATGAADLNAYFARDLPWFYERSAAIATALVALVEHADESWAARTFNLPWLPAPLTTPDGVLQAMLHSAQHRAQVLSALGSRGLSVPDVDYVNMLAEAPPA